MSTDDDAPKSAETEDAPHDAGHGHAVEGPVDPNLIARRQLLGKMSIGLGACGGVALGVPIVGFIVGPLLHPMGHGTPSPDAKEWRPVGKLGEFKVGTTVAVTFADASPLPWAGVTGNTAAWLRRVSETEFVAFSINCAHLGCPVRWLPDAHLFMCPCHGGVYYEDGSVAAGPPPHALSRYPVQLRDGNVLIWPAPIPID
jgi:menaquinol-cytochrome c reductase iron-sulfur subunit